MAYFGPPWHFRLTAEAPLELMASQGKLSLLLSFGSVGKELPWGGLKQNLSSTSARTKCQGELPQRAGNKFGDLSKGPGSLSLLSSTRDSGQRRGSQDAGLGLMQ